LKYLVGDILYFPQGVEGEDHPFHEDVFTIKTINNNTFCLVTNWSPMTPLQEGSVLYCKEKPQPLEYFDNTKISYVMQGKRSHAEGYQTVACNCAHAEGVATMASGWGAHA
jgi:hypothetical protein